MIFSRLWLGNAAVLLSLLLCLSGLLLRLAPAVAHHEPPGILHPLVDGEANRQFRVTLLDRPHPAISRMMAYTDTFGFPEALCVGINERGLWEPGNSKYRLHGHLASGANVELRIDERPISMGIDTMTIRGDLAMLVEYDENNEPVEFGHLDYCINTADFGIGLHAVKLSVRTLSGALRHDMWWLEISEQAAF